MCRVCDVATQTLGEMQILSALTAIPVGVWFSVCVGLYKRNYTHRVKLVMTKLFICIFFGSDGFFLACEFLLFFVCLFFWEGEVVVF